MPPLAVQSQDEPELDEGALPVRKLVSPLQLPGVRSVVTA